LAVSRQRSIVTPIPQLIALAVGAGLGAADVCRAQSLLSGEQVYAEVCSACHGARVDKAPQFGDRQAWAPLIREGQAVLTAHAWVGVRGMPARGGRPELALEEFARATAHMARAAGGRWPDPDPAMLARIEKEVDKRLARSRSAK
jgi:cytochrome c5